QELAKRLRQVGNGPGDQSWIELDQVRKALPVDSVLIELAGFQGFDFQAIKEQKRWQPPRYVAWVIPAQGPVRIIDLGPAEEIDAGVRQVREALQDSPKTIRLKGEADAETAVRGSLEAVARKVLHPLLPYVGKSKRWILGPDSDLWLIPWAALPLPDGK